MSLARGLIDSGVDAPLLATNTSVCPQKWGPDPGQMPLRLYRMVSTLGFDQPTIRAMGGYTRVGRYALDVAHTREHGSRRELLRNLLGYRRFLDEVRPEVIHVQHPLERCAN